jgi:hypothetical protein
LIAGNKKEVFTAVAGDDDSKGADVEKEIDVPANKAPWMFL